MGRDASAGRSRFSTAWAIYEADCGLGIAYSVLLVGVLVSACSSKPTEPQPPEIVYGQEMCDEYGRIIREAKFAAATLTTAGSLHTFDDIGDMLVYHMDHPEEQVRAWFVHDHNSQGVIVGKRMSHFPTANSAALARAAFPGVQNQPLPFGRITA